MYITRVEIENIRSLKHLIWEIDAANAPGWHVILGNNGAGKTTFTQCIVFSMVGSDLLIRSFKQWIRVGCEKGNSTVRRTYIDGYSPEYHFHAQKHDNTMRAYSHSTNDSRNESFFMCSFGAYRRFTGGDYEEEMMFETGPKLVRHLSIFTERLIFADSLNWLQKELFKSLDPIDGDPNSALLLENIKRFVNQNNFLEYDAKLTKITSTAVYITDGNGNDVPAEEMSDGYRSVLSLTFELLRQLSIAYGPDIFETHPDGKVTVKVPGVVQIDEVDAHLHPTWQKRIGFWFREHFPQMQFIVTTHSPLVCQAAEKGSIFLLPRPGTDETGRMLEGAERNRLIYGDILDAYSTEAFGGGETRSLKGQEMLDRLGELNVKEMLQGLTQEEQKEQERLRAAMPSAATAETE